MESPNREFICSFRRLKNLLMASTSFISKLQENTLQRLVPRSAKLIQGPYGNDSALVDNADAVTEPFCDLRTWVEKKTVYPFGNACSSPPSSDVLIWDPGRSWVRPGSREAGYEEAPR